MTYKKASIRGTKALSREGHNKMPKESNVSIQEK